MEEEEPNQQEAEQEQEKTEEDSEQEAEEKEDEGVSYKKVKVTADIPQFLGTDLKVYGPYHPGDAPKLPTKNARVLVNRDRAQVREVQG